ncbi:MAG: PD-(D/E)XK nuclease family transposase [Desulfamplus sp.]|nr:PD-(D/E)XK nuclease family transposase [Desulfamplus sp.]
MLENPQRLIRFDWAIKTLLRDKANFDVLEGFLCALLEDDSIRILHLLESEGNQSHADEKFNRVDMMVEDSLGRRIIIEIQNTRESDYLERLLFGTSKVIVENQKLGEDFRNISKVISISILYFNLGSGDDYLYRGRTNFVGMNTGNPLKIKRVQEIIENFKPRIKFIEKDIFPEYYFIKVENFPDVVKKFIDEWIYLIKNEEVREDFKSKNIDKAREKLAFIHMKPSERASYERYLINLVRERDMLKTAEMDGMEKGEKIGIEKGEKIGIEKGEKMGIEKGIKEIALKMLTMGEPMDKISALTGLTFEEIDQLSSIF